MNMDEITARAQMLIHRPASEVFDSFVHPKKMGEFWFARRDDGLREGESVTWFVGNAPDAPGIEVCTRTLERPKELVIDWGHGDTRTTVSWTFEEKGTGHDVSSHRRTGVLRRCRGSHCSRPGLNRRVQSGHRRRESLS